MSIENEALAALESHSQKPIQELDQEQNVNTQIVPKEETKKQDVKLTQLGKEHLPDLIYEYAKDIAYRKDNSPIEYPVVAALVLL